jgi:hypothetical protein
MTAISPQRRKQLFRIIGLLALGGFLAAIVGGCAHGEAKPASSVIVTVPVDYYNCAKKTKSNWVPPSLSANPHFPQIQQKYKIPSNFIESDNINNVGNRLLYNDCNIMVKDTNFDKIHGAYIVQTSFADWEVNNNDFMELSINDYLTGLYIAYDARVELIDDAPSWLKNDYTRMTNPSNPAEPYILTLSNGQKLQIWESKRSLYKGDKVSLPSNMAGNPTFKPGSKPHPYMYVVIIKPPEEENWSAQVKDSTGYYRACFGLVNKIDYLQTARDHACGLVWPGTRCEAGEPTAFFIWGEKYGYTLTVNNKTFSIPQEAHFSKGTEVEFDKAASLVSVALDGGTPALARVSGKLNFDYELAQNKTINKMNINNLELQIDPFLTKAGEISKVRVNLVKSCTTTCKGPVPSGPLCSKYQIQPEEFVCVVYYSRDGKGYCMGSYNTQPIDIDIDVNNYTFKFAGGPLLSTVEIDDKTVPVEVTIDFQGKFLNIAPRVYVSKETEPCTECVDNRNNASITLVAKAFDPDTPPNPNNFIWYQDYGLVTQKTWHQPLPQGDTLFINKGKLGYGVHNFAVAFTDNYDMRAVENIKIEVQDTTPPELTIPPDIFKKVKVPQESPLPVKPVKINLGKATASDTCLGGVVITNDAPADSRFPVGKTEVTWTADDLRGNVTTRVQKVEISPAK